MLRENRTVIPSLMNELVQLKVDVLVAPTLPAILAASQATKTIPIVMVTNTEPVAAGLVDSLARPGGNITGLSTLSQDLSGKRLELLTEVVPRSHVLQSFGMRTVKIQRLRLKSMRLRHAP